MISWEDISIVTLCVQDCVVDPRCCEELCGGRGGVASESCVIRCEENRAVGGEKVFRKTFPAGKVAERRGLK